jgi:hypothetical protein
VKLKGRVIAVAAAVLLLVALGSTALAFNPRRNVPWEYVCDNDPGVPECGSNLRGNLTFGYIADAWAQDARWRDQQAWADAYYRWIIHTGDQPWQWGSYYEFRVHIPDSDVAFTSHWTTYYEVDSSGQTSRIGTVDQGMNQGNWYKISDAFWMTDNSVVTIESNNGYKGNSPSGVTGFDAIDLWDKG